MCGTLLNLHRLPLLRRFHRGEDDVERLVAFEAVDLVLTDRDWTHPQGGGTGTNLYGQISRWVAWGHKVTVIAGDQAPQILFAPNPEVKLHFLDYWRIILKRRWTVLSTLGIVFVTALVGTLLMTPLIGARSGSLACSEACRASCWPRKPATSTSA